MDTPAVDVDGFPLQQPAQECERLVGQPAAPIHVKPEMLVFLRAVADSEGVGDPPLADDVQDAHFLRQPDRIPERDRHGRQKDRELLGAGGNRGREDVRNRQMTVVSTVMLGQDGDQRAARLCPCTHVDGPRVEVSRGCTKGGRSHVEPQGEHSAPHQGRGSHADRL